MGPCANDCLTTLPFSFAQDGFSFSSCCFSRFPALNGTWVAEDRKNGRLGDVLPQMKITVGLTSETILTKSTFFGALRVDDRGFGDDPVIQHQKASAKWISEVLRNVLMRSSPSNAAAWCLLLSSSSPIFGKDGRPWRTSGAPTVQPKVRRL